MRSSKTTEKKWRNESATQRFLRLLTAGRLGKLNTMDNALLQNIGSIQLYPSLNQFSSEFTYHTFGVHSLDSWGNTPIPSTKGAVDPCMNGGWMIVGMNERWMIKWSPPSSLQLFMSRCNCRKNKMYIYFRGYYLVSFFSRRSSRPVLPWFSLSRQTITDKFRECFGEYIIIIGVARDIYQVAK